MSQKAKRYFIKNLETYQWLRVEPGWKRGSFVFVWTKSKSKATRFNSLDDAKRYARGKVRIETNGGK